MNVVLDQVAEKFIHLSADLDPPENEEVCRKTDLYKKLEHDEKKIYSLLQEKGYPAFIENTKAGLDSATIIDKDEFLIPAIDEALSLIEAATIHPQFVHEMKDPEVVLDVFGIGEEEENRTV